MTPLGFFIVASASILLTAFYFRVLDKSELNFNGRYAYADSRIKDVVFTIEKVEIAYDTENFRLGRYVVGCGFFDKKGMKGYHSNKFIFYDRLGKYNVGDTLTIIKTDN